MLLGGRATTRGAAKGATQMRHIGNGADFVETSGHAQELGTLGALYKQETQCSECVASEDPCW